MNLGDTLEARAAALAPALRVWRPAGPGPFPVVLLFHGCGGPRPFLNDYAATAVDCGAAAVLVDSFAPRGIGRRAASLTVCTGARLRGLERAGDLFATLHWLRGQAWADPMSVAAVGWSHGGWLIMDALAVGAGAARGTGLRDAHPACLEALKATVLIYPYAAFPSLTASRGWGGSRPAVYSVLGGRDAVAGVGAPEKAFERLRRDGVSVDTLLFPDATHAFEDDGANDPRSRHRPDLARKAHAYMAQALSATLF